MSELLDFPEALLSDKEIVAVIRAYNEIIRLPYVLDHHRKIGINRFIIIDNSSTDGTSEYICSQSDCIYIHADGDYRKYKEKWINDVANHYCDKRWTLMIDADELFVYPGYPNIKIQDISAYLEENNYGGVICTLVDMYAPKIQISDNFYNDLAEIAPYFDERGYRLTVKTPSELRRRPTPPYHIYGGARERLFYEPRKRSASKLDKFLIDKFMNVKKYKKSFFNDLANIISKKIVSGALPRGAPKMTKVPLLYWKKGYVWTAHDLEYDVSVSSDRFALLHFKLLHDFEHKVAESVEREQHSSMARHYKLYQKNLPASFFSDRSTSYTEFCNLEEAGLVTTSNKFRQWMRRMRLKQ